MIMLDTDDFSEIYKDDDIDYNDISPVLSTHNWSTEGEYWLDHLNWQIRFDTWMYLDIGYNFRTFSDAWHQKATSHRSGTQRDLYLVYQGALNLHIDDGDSSLFSSSRVTTFS